MKPSEHCLYHSQSPRIMTRFGHFRRAIDTGSGTRMPNFLAGMEAAVTMLRRSFGSPDTTDGTSRMSGLPSLTSLAPSQLTKALFTSI